MLLAPQRTPSTGSPAINLVILTKFNLKTKAKSRKVRGKRHILIRAPKCGKSKRWNISVKFNYADGTSKSFSLRQKCKR